MIKTQKKNSNFTSTERIENNLDRKKISEIIQKNKTLFEKVGLLMGLHINVKKVPIKIIDGMPVNICSWPFDLIEKLKKLENEEKQLKKKIEDTKEISEISPNLFQRGIIKLNEYKNDLTREINKVKEEIHTIIAGIHGDIFGQYHYNRTSQCIKIYYEPILKFSNAFNIQLENLIIIVLCHEIVHALSNIGTDMDENQWLKKDFASSEDKLIESIAQYYTKKYCEKNHDLNNDFEKLLEYQNDNYTVFKKDFSDFNLEIVHSALVKTRNLKIHHYGLFLEMLHKINIIGN